MYNLTYPEAVSPLNGRTFAEMVKYMGMQGYRNPEAVVAKLLADFKAQNDLRDSMIRDDLDRLEFIRRCIDDDCISDSFTYRNCEALFRLMTLTGDQQSIGDSAR
jgi:hypothetical protein